MECTKDELHNTAVKKDVNDPTQLPDVRGFQNLLDRAQLLLGYGRTVAEREIAVATESNEAESLVISRSTGSSVLKDYQKPLNLQLRKTYKAQALQEVFMICLKQKRLLALQQKVNGGQSRKEEITLQIFRIVRKTCPLVQTFSEALQHLQERSCLR